MRLRKCSVGQDSRGSLDCNATVTRKDGGKTKSWRVVARGLCLYVETKN